MTTDIRETSIKQILNSEIAFSKGQTTRALALTSLFISSIISALIGPVIVRHDVACLNSLQMYPCFKSVLSSSQVQELLVPIQLRSKRINSIPAVTNKEIKVLRVLSGASRMSLFAYSVECWKSNILLLIVDRGF